MAHADNGPGERHGVDSHNLPRKRVRIHRAIRAEEGGRVVANVRELAHVWRLKRGPIAGGKVEEAVGRGNHRRRAVRGKLPAQERLLPADPIVDHGAAVDDDLLRPGDHSSGGVVGYLRGSGRGWGGGGGGSRSRRLGGGKRRAPHHARASSVRRRGSQRCCLSGGRQSCQSPCRESCHAARPSRACMRDLRGGTAQQGRGQAGRQSREARTRVGGRRTRRGQQPARIAQMKPAL